MFFSHFTVRAYFSSAPPTLWYTFVAQMKVRGTGKNVHNFVKFALDKAGGSLKYTSMVIISRYKRRYKLSAKISVANIDLFAR